MNEVFAPQFISEKNFLKTISLTPVDNLCPGTQLILARPLIPGIGLDTKERK